VGSNIGDKKRNCLRAIKRLSSNEQADIVERSRFYRTEPVDYLDQDWFVNAVVKVKTYLEPFDLLKAMISIEDGMGRERLSTPRFGPRIIDLDLILFDMQQIESEALVLPHPRMHRRRFVLEPICDIEPELIHPVSKKTMRQLLDDAAVQSQRLIMFEKNGISKPFSVLEDGLE
jgi:2-amino-4-hydroxy-6-hydroxymethyldihydropteridine diphosphokinase